MKKVKHKFCSDWKYEANCELVLIDGKMDEIW
jgi:hypothetical protein